MGACLLVTGGLAALAASPAFSDEPAVKGSMIQTDGMLTKAQARRLPRVSLPRRARLHAANTAQSDDRSGLWLIDYVSRLLDTEPAVARRPRTAHREAAAPRVPSSVPSQRLAAVVPDAVAAPTPIPPTSPIATGTVIPARPDASPTGIAGDALIVAAERFQARADLVKLEFSSRTYDERKLSGQQVFDFRTDWRVLERARDALTGAELSSAVAAGFEANAYINDATKTIVVAVAGSQDLRRDFLGADVWHALIKSQAPQQFYMAKTYVRSVMQRYQMQGYSTECVGHSLGGGACAYAAAELGIRALVLNPISAGKLAPGARYLVTNYVVDGDIANLIYGARGHEFTGNVQVINDGRDAIRLMALEKYGQLAGPILVVRELRASIDSHKVDHALDLIAVQAEVSRPR
jgi:hypothetical protein